MAMIEVTRLPKLKFIEKMVDDWGGHPLRYSEATGVRFDYRIMIVSVAAGHQYAVLTLIAKDGDTAIDAQPRCFLNWIDAAERARWIEHAEIRALAA